MQAFVKKISKIRAGMNSILYGLTIPTAIMIMKK